MPSTICSKKTASLENISALGESDSPMTIVDVWRSGQRCWPAKSSLTSPALLRLTLNGLASEIHRAEVWRVALIESLDVHLRLLSSKHCLYEWPTYRSSVSVGPVSTS